MGRLDEFKQSVGASSNVGSAMIERYFATRKYTEFICEPLMLEDYVVQPAPYVSPPKWHLAHTTWFFEELILAQFLPDYKPFHPRYSFLFNSYYEGLGEHLQQGDRGNLSRPTVDEIQEYRAYVDQHMIQLFAALPPHAESLVELGINHEQQHQELLYTDIKYALGHNPLFPLYHVDFQETPETERDHSFHQVPAGDYTIGSNGLSFSFDNEQPLQRIYLKEFSVRKSLVTNGEYLAFMSAGGYGEYRHWLSDGWNWIRENQITKPLYWLNAQGSWYRYALSGLEKINPEEPVTHVSFYEASAFADWSGMRLPTEYEWEVASQFLKWGLRWEHTNSAFLPYAGYKKPEGAISEYNGKFMVNTMVLRGASVVTPANHSRPSYRNFFYPYLRWQFNGIRLCKK